MRAAIILAALLTVASGVNRAHGQLIGESAGEPPSTRGYVAIGARGAQPLNDFADYIDFGYGFGGHVAHALDARGVLSLRGNLDVLWYGHETTRHGTGFGGSLDVTTSNNIYSIGIGPHVTIPGQGVRPFATGTVGFSYFSTSTSVEWRNSNETLDSWTDFSDAVTAWTAGGGFLVPLSRGRRPVLLELSAMYHGNGEAEYLREGSISRDEDGNAIFTPIRSRTNMVLYTIGVSFGAW